ncbi:TRAP transporter small permease subunit [Cuneatibacter sp. NSJ-177]|uniref:TRAP transporter small permease n=1 Tax=Cuneatibacter sp. NSJ-177 TaxID=2931401 RepID=UPI001FD1ECC9|nr:TRAP transporter small permease subunit [Cuneatibacter sp. NSJ-177]MCJ7834434.1 TRAP transporter small permease subunit [Cuneatibacter sp. NSJ-177]
MDDKNFIMTNPRLRFFRYFITLNRVLVALAGFGMFVMMCTTVIARYILKVDLNGLNEYLYFCMIWLFFMGAGVGAFEKSHLNADVFDVLFQNKRLLAANTFVRNTLELLLYVAFFYCSVCMIQRGVKIPMYTEVHHLPYLIGYAAVCYSGFMMMVYTTLHYCFYIYHLVTDRRDRGTKEKEAEQ